MSNCISEPWSDPKSPTNIFNASATCVAETVAIIGIITPAVSHVGDEPASGISSNMHRKHGVLPGMIVIVVP